MELADFGARLRFAFGWGVIREFQQMLWKIIVESGCGARNSFYGFYMALESKLEGCRINA
jgi:hypothetical protein